MASEVDKLEERIIDYFEKEIDLILRKRKGSRKYVFSVIKRRYNLMYGTKLEELRCFFNNKDNYKTIRVEKNGEEYITIKFSNKHILSFN
jgi:hypothetical protein